MGKKKVFGTCALCDKENVVLELSHIIPKFVIRYLKKISIGKIRTVGEPNAVAQDSEKHYLLCGDCEDRFNLSETLFADKVFRPFQFGRFTSIDYDKWMHYFLTSVSWRSLILDIDYFEEEGKIHPDDLKLLKGSADIMKDYLMGRREDIGYIENHLFFFEEISSIPEEYKGLDIHMSVSGTQGSYTVHNHEAGTHATFTNMMGVLLFTIYSYGPEEKWENTLISLNKGTISVGGQFITSTLGMEIQYLAKSLEEAKTKLTDKTIDNINKTVEKNKDKIPGSRMLDLKLKDSKF